MIIIKFSGALGNQLFQYALYYKLSFLKKEVKADLSLFNKGTESRIFYLKEIGIQLQEASEKEIKNYATGEKLSQKFLTRIGYKKAYFRDNPVYTYHPEVFELDNAYLDGYWQCPKFFQDIRTEIKNSIRFPKLLGKNKEIETDIFHSNSVSLHIRLKDYLLLSDVYGEICTLEYYNKAIGYIKEKIEKPKFFVFSDDIKMAQRILENIEAVWVDNNSENNAYDDLHLMSLCKHNIIANSSFSWWAAWLNSNENSVTIAPKQWLNSQKLCDIWCEGWVKL